MSADQVIDASVVGAAFFNEAHSSLARRFLAQASPLFAPTLLVAEIASLSAKKVWRGEASSAAGERALAVLPDFVGTFVDLAPLAERAFQLAAQHRFSAYDGFYLALAESRACRVVTLDARLIDRARSCGLEVLVASLAESLPG